MNMETHKVAYKTNPPEGLQRKPPLSASEKGLQRKARPYNRLIICGGKLLITIGARPTYSVHLRGQIINLL